MVTAEFAKRRRDAVAIVRILDYLDGHQGSTSKQIQEAIVPRRSIVQIRELIRKGIEIGDIKRIGSNQFAEHYTRIPQ